MSNRHPAIDWRSLTRRIESSLKGVPGFGDRARVEGKLSYISEGIGHDNYSFYVAGISYILRMPKRIRPIRSQREALTILKREAETLRRLEQCSPSFHVPKFVSEVFDEVGAMIGFIETTLNGYPLKYMGNGWNDRSRLTIAGEMAARVHELPVSEFSHLEAHADSEAHVRSALEALPAQALENPVVDAAKKWILANVSKRPAVVLHGDLLPQNILCDIQDGQAIHLVDWERAQIGDPASDLAILTRGARQPLKEPNGRRKLLDAYAETSGKPIEASAVRIHELLMIMEWLAGSMDARTRREGSGHGPEYYEAQLLAVLRTSQSGHS